MAREMADSGDFVVPRLNGDPFLEKPPLEYAAAAESIRLFGPTLEAARLPSAFFGLVAMLSVLTLGWRLSGTSTGACMAAAVLATSFYFQDTVHSCLTNAPLVAAVALAMFAFERIAETRNWIAWGALFYAALGFGFLSKNLYGVAVPGIAVIAYSLVTRDLRAIRRLLLSPAPLVFLAMVLPWLCLLYRAGQGESPPKGYDFLREVLIANNFGRFFLGYGGHDSYQWYEVAGFIAAAVVPWSPLALLALLANLRESGAADPALRRRAQLLSTWMVGPVLMVAASRSKRPDYMVAIIPAFAVATGVWWSEVIRDPSRRIERMLLLLAGLAAAAGPFALAIEDFIVRGGAGWISISASAVGLLLLLIAVVCIRRGTLAALAMVTVLGAIMLSMAALDPAIVQARDRDSAGSFGEDLTESCPAGVVGALGFGEREFGLSYFYLGRTVTDLKGRTFIERARFLADPRTAGILIASGPHGERKTPVQLIDQYLGPAPPPVRVRLEGMVGGRRLLFVTYVFASRQAEGALPK